MKQRNNSAIHVFSHKSAVLMDCAEGTYGQLVDYFGDGEKLEQVMLKTKVVFITHLHGDHTLGLARFLQERDSLLANLTEEERSSIFVLAP